MPDFDIIWLQLAELLSLQPKQREKLKAELEIFNQFNC